MVEVQPHENVLVVGDGNLSWSCDLARRWFDIDSLESPLLSLLVEQEKYGPLLMEALRSAKRLCVTAFDERNRVLNELSGTKNVEKLEGLGAQYGNVVSTRFEVDATRLESTFEKEHFTCVFFNFPHTHKGKMRMDLNRKLLRGFFKSVVNVITDSGLVFVTLAKGQGGTEADKEYMRKWGDTWQVTDQAASAGLGLVEAAPFPIDWFPSYASCGFRGGSKGFHRQGSITHVFSKCIGNNRSIVYARTYDRQVSYWVPISLSTDDATQALIGVMSDLYGKVEFTAKMREEYFPDSSFSGTKDSIGKKARLVPQNCRSLLFDVKYSSTSLPLCHEAISDIESDVGAKLEESYGMIHRVR